MFKSGKYVAEHIEAPDDEELSDEQVQPLGVELTIGSLKYNTGLSELSNGEYNDGNWEEANKTSDGRYTLRQGYYRADLREKVSIPEDCVGVAFGRSRLMRSGVQLATAMWDPGYTGRGQVGMYVFNRTYMDEGFRPFQLALCEANPSSTYDGSHQGENL